MKPFFLFPADPLNDRRVDYLFAAQADALVAAGFDYALVDLADTRRITRRRLEGQDAVVYRGWMLSEAEYDLMAELVGLGGGKLLVSKQEYYAAHHLPNWYPLVEGLTPETLVFPGGTMTEWKTTVAAGWPKIQVKDYVKSLKTKGGSVISDPAELLPVLERMQQYRGEIEGGVCLRRYEDFLQSSEKRYFVIGKRFYGQEEMLDMRAMEILVRVARDIPSPFFSVDVAIDAAHGRGRIVEIGDGQVSDLVGWTPERFAEIWKRSES